jgi:hypothetical protein
VPAKWSAGRRVALSRLETSSALGSRSLHTGVRRDRGSPTAGGPPAERLPDPCDREGRPQGHEERLNIRRSTALSQRPHGSQVLRGCLFMAPSVWRSLAAPGRLSPTGRPRSRHQRGHQRSAKQDERRGSLLDCSGYMRMVWGYRHHLPGAGYPERFRSRADTLAHHAAAPGSGDLCRGDRCGRRCRRAGWPKAAGRLVGAMSRHPNRLP